MKKLAIKKPEVLEKAVKKVSSSVALGSAMFSNFVVRSHAMSLPSVTVNSSTNPVTAMGKIIGLLLTILTYGGGAVAAFGVFELGLALFAEGQADKKPKAVLAIAAGLLMAGTKAILQALGVVS